MNPTPFEIVLSVARQGAETCFAKYGKVRPVAILHTPARVVIAPLVGEDKNALDAGLRTLIAEVGAQAVAVIFEGYVAAVSLDDFDRADREGLADWPGRWEIVAITAESATKARQEEARITRDAAGRGTLGPFEVQAGGAVRRFGGFFTRGGGN